MAASPQSFLNDWAAQNSNVIAQCETFVRKSSIKIG